MKSINVTNESTNESIAKMIDGFDIGAAMYMPPEKGSLLSIEFIESARIHGFTIVAPLNFDEPGEVYICGAVRGGSIRTSNSSEPKWDNVAYINRCGICRVDSEHGEITCDIPKTIQETLRLAAEYQASTPLRAIPLDDGGFNYCLDIPHATFALTNEGRPMGQGLVFSIKDLPEYKDGDI